MDLRVSFLASGNASAAPSIRALESGPVALASADSKQLLYKEVWTQSYRSMRNCFLVSYLQCPGLSVSPLQCPGLSVSPLQCPGLSVSHLQCPGLSVSPLQCPGLSVSPLQCPAGLSVFPLQCPAGLSLSPLQCPAGLSVSPPQVSAKHLITQPLPPLPTVTEKDRAKIEKKEAKEAASQRAAFEAHRVRDECSKCLPPPSRGSVIQSEYGFVLWDGQ